MFNADPGRLSRIRFFPSRIPGQKDSGAWIRICIKDFSFLTQKLFQALGIMIQDGHPGSRIRILIFYTSRIPDLEVKKAPDPPHWVQQCLRSPKNAQCGYGLPFIFAFKSFKKEFFPSVRFFSFNLPLIYGHYRKEKSRNFSQFSLKIF
jgi:hypothetical protein